MSRGKGKHRQRKALRIAVVLIPILFSILVIAVVETKPERDPFFPERRQTRNSPKRNRESLEAMRAPATSNDDRPVLPRHVGGSRSRTPAVAVTALSKEVLKGYFANSQVVLRRDGGHPLFWAPDLSAIHRRNFSGSPDEIVASLGPHVFLKREPPSLPNGASAGIPFDPSGPYPVAVRKQRGMLGVITGTVFVQLKPGADLAELARSHGFMIFKPLPRLSGGFIRPSAPLDLSAALEAIRSDDRVIASELEILESRVGAR